MGNIHRTNVKPAMRGFTLLEVLVAISIFALMSAIAYSGLITVLDIKEQTDAEAVYLKQLQTALFFVERDIRYAVDRPVRDPFGDVQAAMTGSSIPESGLALTRTGRRNPMQKKRSALERVRYSLLDNKLLRASLPVLDSVQNTEPVTSELIGNIESLGFRFLEKPDNWLDSWPPLDTGDEEQATLPLAVEVTLKTLRWGNITRIITVTGS